MSLKKILKDFCKDTNKMEKELERNDNSGYEYDEWDEMYNQN